MSADQPLPVDVIAKVDPEALAIRTQPLRAVRFKRGAIIGIAALGSVGLMAVTWVALAPSIPRIAVGTNDLSEPGATSRPDVLEALPPNYDAVPKLGPPLPGDLGPPMLRQQRIVSAQEDFAPPDPQNQADAAARQQALSERAAARESGVFAKSGGAGAVPVAAMTSASSPNEPMPMSIGREPDGDPNAQDRKAAFVAASSVAEDTDPHRLHEAPSPYILSAGSVIAASLITGLRSDLPGIVTAQVTENVFDSPTGRFLLIPQGARLIGVYDSVIAFGQARALLVWQRIILPNGSSLAIDNVPAADAAGYAGLADKVDRHTWSLLKGVVLSTLLGVSSELALSADGDLVEAIRQSTQGTVSRAGDQITSKNLGVQPTITIRPGAPVRLVVHKDLILPPWRA